MYFPVGWPKYLDLALGGETADIKSVFCNRDRSLFCILTANSISIWYFKPCVEIVSFSRSKTSVDELGGNVCAEWKLDSSMICIVTSKQVLVFLKIGHGVNNDSYLYTQHDSNVNSLKRESAELFTRESIPNLNVSQFKVTKLSSSITCLISIRDELMVCTEDGSIKRIRWDGTINSDYCLRLPRIPFTVDQHLSKATPLNDEKAFVSNFDYSPLLGGFSLVFSDGNAAFLTGSTLHFEPNQVHGIWVQDSRNTTCTSINHKFRLIAFGLQNAQGVVYSIDEVTGGLQVSHRLILSPKDFPDVEGAAGAVKDLSWSPDGTVIVLVWEKGGISLWSVFGSLLMCTLNWTSSFDRLRSNFSVCSVEWSVEGYSLWMVCGHSDPNNVCDNMKYHNVTQLQFIKSILTVNPCMSSQSRVVLQGEDRLYINAGDAVVGEAMAEDSYQQSESISNSANGILGNKQWLVIQVPHSYLRENWPIRYACIDHEGQHIAVAGISGLAHFSIALKRWKLFGNESQERDFIVTGGILWWKEYLIVGCYNFLENRDEVRLYTRNRKLDNTFVKIVKVPNQVQLLSRHEDQLAVFTADSQISIYNLRPIEHGGDKIQIQKEQVVDISALAVHPACVISITLSSLRAECVRNMNNNNKDLSIIINVCGKLVMVQKDQTTSHQTNGPSAPKYTSPVVLASSVENVWVSSKIATSKLHLNEALWISSGAHGMRVWLPLLPRDGEKPHNFMSKRIMLPISIPICPLAVLFEDAVILGAENDLVVYFDDFTPSSSSTSSSSSSLLPYSLVNRTSQVYLHHIFRQLLRRNLGLHAWEIARSCNGLPYFPHSLELLLHEVLEEEATSSEPIPDALLPRVVDFIREFPVFLQTIVQCARKIEIALWHYLFTTVGNPKLLFQECLDKKRLETAASYLIILQNLESAHSSRQHATVLLDSALDSQKWELAKDIIRFLCAIDPQDLESSPRTPSLPPLSTTSKYPAVSPYVGHSSSVGANEDDLTSMFGVMQVIGRNRAHCTANQNSVKLPSQNPEGVSSVNSINKQSHSNVTRANSDSRVISRRLSSGRDTTDDFFLDTILHCHARKLLAAGQMYDLGNFAAHLDFHLVSFLTQERSNAAKIDDYVMTLKKLHAEFKWPYPVSQHPLASYSLSKVTQNSYEKSNDIAGKDVNKSSVLRLDVSNNVKMAENNIGDSGYISNSANGPNNAEAEVISSMMDAFLAPSSRPDESASLALELSDECSLWSDDPGIDNESPITWSGLSLGQDLDFMSQELASKGPSQSEVQLRYLLQMLLEAGCLEWSMIISVILRDVMAFIRTVNCARQLDYPDKVLLKLRNGIMAISKWVDSECLGYKSFILALQNQIQLLNKLMKQSPRCLKLQSNSSAEEVPQSISHYKESIGPRSKTNSEKSNNYSDDALAENDLLSNDIFENHNNFNEKDDVFKETDSEHKSVNEGENCTVS